MSRYKLSAVVTPGGTISQITERTYNPNLSHVMLKGDGRMTPHFAGIMSGKPMKSFSTQAVKSALDIIGLGYYKFAAESAAYYAQLSTSGGFTAGGTHAKVAGSLGCIVPIELSAQHDGLATLSCELHWISADGVASPTTYASNVSLPALTLSEAFTLGPASINGSALTDLESLRIRFNYRLVNDAGDGNAYPTFICYDEFAPEISVKLKDPNQAFNLGLAGVAQGATASKFFLRRMAAGGTRVANGTAQHIKLTVAAGFHRPDPVNDSDDKYSDADLVTHITDNGTDAVMAVSTGSAIA